MHLVIGMELHWARHWETQKVFDWVRHLALNLVMHLAGLLDPQQVMLLVDCWEMH